VPGPTPLVTNLTDIDHEIIDCLRADGRTSANEIARTLDADYRLIRTRLSALLDSGTVRINALADPALVGNTTVAFLWVESWSASSGVNDLLTGLPEVMWAARTTAGTRTVAQISCATAGDLLRIVEEVRAHPTVGTATAELVLRSYVGPLASTTADGRPDATAVDPAGSLWLGGPDNSPLDDLDHRILDMLRTDGRVGLTAIAETVEVPLTTVRRRVNRLLDIDGVRLRCLVSPVALGYLHTVGVTVQVSRDAAGVARFLTTLPDAMWVSEITGARPVTVELVARDLDGIDAALARITADDRVRGIHVDYYEETIKETGGW